MVELLVRFKSNTSKEWAKKKMIEIGLDREVSFKDHRKHGLYLSAIVSIPDEDELRHSRVIRSISPQVVSVKVR